ncbi:hypothetical protein HZB04_00440 [Candidatus Wolfebacteria bacterium]|nr:hypothetical protein [Candidatus Wolfebacteria bacterium]
MIFKIIFLFGTVYYSFEPFTWFSTILIFLGLPILIFIIKKFINFFNHPLILDFKFLILFLPFLWTIFDHLEARWTLYPTYIITAGNNLGSSPFLGLAAFGGLTTLTFFIALINILIVFIVVKYQTKIYNSAVIISISIIIAIIFIGWQISQFELQKNKENYAGLSNFLRIAVVSTNEKFKEQDLEYLKNEIKKENGINLLIIPEDIFNNSFIGEGYDPVNNTPAKSLVLMRDLAKELNVNLLTVFDTDEPKRVSSMLFNKKGEIIDMSHKIHLTFIGEWWPFGNWQPFYFKWVKNINPKFKNYMAFNSQNPYLRGEKKLLTLPDFDFALFASLICVEIHYPEDLKKYKNMGAKFIVNPASNRWLGDGLEHYLYLTNNLRKIESVWLKIPIIVSGVKDSAGIITPDGDSNLAPYEDKNKNFNLFIGEIKFF